MNKRVSVSKRTKTIHQHSGCEFFGVVKHLGYSLNIDGDEYGVIPMMYSVAVVNPKTGGRLVKVAVPDEHFETDVKLREFIRTTVAERLVDHIAKQDAC